MAQSKKSTRTSIDAIRHNERRANIPTEELREFVRQDETAPKKMLYPRDPSLDPQLVWRGKDEQDSADLEVPVVPIYIQEKVHPQAIIDDFVRTARKVSAGDPSPQMSLFADFNGLEDDFGRRVDFYSHDEANRPHWTNRMILGDSLLVMTSLAEKEGLKGQVQMIYLDPPYGIKFGSNWQVSTRKREVQDNKVADTTRQPEQIRAFRDTWKHGVHSYLAYLRDRLICARNLLTDTGSIFVQIGDENLHLVRSLLDEVFGPENVCAQISFAKTVGATSELLPGTLDYILWYCKDRERVKYRSLFREKTAGAEGASAYTRLQLPDGRRRPTTNRERSGEETPPTGARVMTVGDLTSARVREGRTGYFPIEIEGKTFLPPKREWSTHRVGIERLKRANRIERVGTANLGYVRFLDDFPAVPLTNLWPDTVGQNQFGGEKTYVVQTGLTTIRRCLLMTTDPGDIVLDPTCGSGTTAYVAEQWGRRWITIDTSRVALALARTRLMSAKYPYYHLADDYPNLPLTATDDEVKAHLRQTAPAAAQPDIKKGFVYRRVPHITLKSIANNPEIDGIHDAWQPQLDALRAELNAKAGQRWEEWEIPRPDAKTKADLLPLLERWWDLRRRRQAEIDAAIARHADTETLFDQPYEDTKRIRVAGPFTVESLSPHRMLSASDDGRAAPPPVDDKTRDYRKMIIDNIRRAGVQNTKKDERLKFDRLDDSPGPHIHASGDYTDAAGNSRRVAIHIGPEHGTVSNDHIRTAAIAAKKGVGHDLLLVLGFAFDPMVNVEAQNYGSLDVQIVRMNFDLTMGDELLKKTGAGNLFVIFGEPDIEIGGDADGNLIVTLHGLDIYDPTIGDIRPSRGTDDIACWFIDTDYNEESFFVRHAYFTGADEPYDKLRRALRAEVDESAWADLYRTTSRPFPRPERGKIAVKVINHYGDEVVKVFLV